MKARDSKKGEDEKDTRCLQKHIANAPCLKRDIEAIFSLSSVFKANTGRDFIKGKIRKMHAFQKGKAREALR